MSEKLVDASNEWSFKTMAMADLTAPSDTQLRVEGVNEARAQEYSESIKELPAVDVFVDADEGTTWVSDGHHRHRAHEIAKVRKIKTRWKKGTLRDAILHAIKSNHGHGLHRSNADKRNAVRYMLRDDQWRKKSDRWIATQVGVSHTLVAGIRNELYPPQVATDASSVAEPAKREGADGKAYPARQPIPKPGGKRKSKGAKMGYEPPRGTATAPDADGFEAPVEGDLTLCPYCSKMVPDGLVGACLDESPDDPDPETSPDSAAEPPPEELPPDAHHPTVVGGRPLRRPSPAPGSPPPAPEPVKFQYQSAQGMHELELINASLMVGVNREWNAFNLDTLSKEAFERFVEAMREARS